MGEDRDNPLSRWSRRKHEAARLAEKHKSARRAADAPPPELPALDQLGPDSDFRAFMDPRVDDALRRLALKKLFGDPRFNVTDGLDVYAEDYSVLEDLPRELVEKLEHARSTLRRPEPEQLAEAPPDEGGGEQAARPEQGGDAGQEENQDQDQNRDEDKA